MYVLFSISGLKSLGFVRNILSSVSCANATVQKPRPPLKSQKRFYQNIQLKCLQETDYACLLFLLFSRPLCYLNKVFLILLFPFILCPVLYFMAIICPYARRFFSWISGAQFCLFTRRRTKYRKEGEKIKLQLIHLE